MAISLTRDQYRDSIRQLSGAAEKLGARLNMNQLTWQPAEGEGWSILECLDHIAISTNVYLDAMDQAIFSARPGPAAEIFRTAGFISTKFVASQEPPVARKLPSPGKIRPRPTLKPELILPEFQKTMDRVTALVESTKGKDLNSVRFRNPLIPLLRFTVATGFLVIASHGRRHIWQAEQVEKQTGFPA